jgi:hypothetical protein
MEVKNNNMSVRKAASGCVFSESKLKIVSIYFSNSPIPVSLPWYSKLSGCFAD